MPWGDEGGDEGSEWVSAERRESVGEREVHYSGRKIEVVLWFLPPSLTPRLFPPSGREERGGGEAAPAGPTVAPGCGWTYP